jgi:flagellar hook-length control protein FliK
MAEATQALLAQVVKAARLAWTSRGGEARLTVDAGSDLGHVQVVLHVARGQVSAALQAEAAMVQQVLEAARGDLQRGLAEHGLDLHRFAVSVSPDGRRRQAAADEPPARRPRARRPDVRFEEFA